MSHNDDASARGVDFLIKNTVAKPASGQAPDAPLPLPPPKKEAKPKKKRTARENRIAALEKIEAEGRTRGRQEGFVIEPAEIITIIMRAVEAWRAKPYLSRNPRHALELLLGFAFGLRITDFVDLTWDQVLHHKTFVVHEEKHATRRRKAREQEKVVDGKLRRKRTIKPRVVEVPESVRVLAQELYDGTSKRYRHETYVFGKLGRRKYNRTQEHYAKESNDRWSSASMGTDFKTACRLYGTPEVSDMAFYSCCRPSSARWRYEILLEQTGSHEMALATVQSMYGHATPQQTIRYLKLHKDAGMKEAIQDKFMNFTAEQPTLTTYKEATREVPQRNERRRGGGGKERFRREDTPPAPAPPQTKDEVRAAEPPPPPPPAKPTGNELIDDLLYGEL